MLKLTPSHYQPLSLPPYLLPFSLLQTCKTQQDVKRAHALSLRACAFNQPSAGSLLLVLYADPKINRLNYARLVFDLISNPDLVTLNILIKCYVENQRSYDTICLFHNLVYEFTPDGFTLPSVLKGYACLNAISERKQIHRLGVKVGFGLDKFAQSSLVSIYSRCGENGYARKVFDQMDKKDLVLWNSLLDGCARCGQTELALQLFDEMPERDYFLWSCLVDGLSKCGRVEMARVVFDRMPSRNLISWNALINEYMKTRDFEMTLVDMYVLSNKNIKYF